MSPLLKKVLVLTENVKGNEDQLHRTLEKLHESEAQRQGFEVSRKQELFQAQILNTTTEALRIAESESHERAQMEMRSNEKTRGQDAA